MIKLRFFAEISRTLLTSIFLIFVIFRYRTSLSVDSIFDMLRLLRNWAFRIEPAGFFDSWAVLYREIVILLTPKLAYFFRANWELPGEAVCSSCYDDIRALE